MKNHHNPFIRILGAFLLVTAMLVQLLPYNDVSAAQITDRSLTLQTGTATADAGSKPGGSVNHRFTFDLPTNATIGSIKFEYCTTASGVSCTAPTGLSTTASPAVLGTSTGAVFTNITNPSGNVSYISRTAANYAGGTVTVRLDNVVNPSAPNSTFFVRISTYASEDTTGSPIDSGTVTASTARQILLDGTMPESLVFCTGETIGLTGGVPDCATALDGSISFNQLFSPTDTATARSQMAASTNAGAGYAVTVHGSTLTSGSNTIAPMVNAGGPTTPIRGTSQFGLNLIPNTTAVSTQALGTTVAPAFNGTNYNGQPAANYSNQDNFEFTSGDSIATSSSGSDAQIFTIGYIANVPGSQPAGTYTTTLTYICTPTF